MNATHKKITRILQRDPLVAFAYLFGSRAKGVHDARSDWDIAVFLNGSARSLSRWNRFYLEADISPETGGEVQVTILNGLDSPVFLFEIINSGILLVDKDPEKRIVFEAQVLAKYHDWDYILQRRLKTRKG